MVATRTEHDALGPVEVPAERLWGAQTQRSLIHFAISGERLPAEFIVALASVKRACATVNADLGLLAPDIAGALAAAANEVMAGRHADEFPLVVWQTGSGTQSNMNMNEVLAHRAALWRTEQGQETRTIHPNDEVNLGQSSNDVFPTALHLAAALGISQNLLPTLATLRATLQRKAADFADLIKLGRTHLQDATPLTLGDEYSGYVAQLDLAHAVIAQALPQLYPLAIGGTAVGTGLNTHPEFGARVAADLARRHALPFISASNKFAALAAHDALVSVHGALKTSAVALIKIANDLRWLASGPRSGLGEILLPENEPGSSMMPGKVNPTQCEAMIMLGYQVMANDVAVGLAGASGNFELNVCKPLLAHALLQSIRLLGDGLHSFDTYCARGIEANPAQMATHLERSLMLVTALVPHIGYDRAAAIARHAHLHHTTLRESALELDYATEEELDVWLDPATMLGHRH